MSHPSALRTLSTPLDRVRPPSGAGKGPLIAIDLGVARCKVAVMGPNGPQCVTSGGRRSIDACLALLPSGQVVAGQDAERILGAHPELAVWGAKTLLQPFGSIAVRRLAAQLQCEVFELQDGGTGVRLGDRDYPASDLVAMLLCEAREWAQEQLKVPVERAVITGTPGLDGGFLDQATAISLRAGLRLEAIVLEPAAVAVSAQAQPQALRRARAGEPRFAAVCDWGASGLRFWVVEEANGNYRPLVSFAEGSVGGMEIDRWVYRQLLAQSGVEERLLAEVGAAGPSRLLAAAERAKVDLSHQSRAVVSLPCAYYDSGAPRDLQATLTRRTLEGFMGPLVDRALHRCRKGLQEVGLSPDGLHALFLVGEQSHSPIVQQRCRAFFGQVPWMEVDPAAAAVLGAVRMAGG